MNTITTENTDMGMIPIDIYTKLSNDRILFIHDRIDDHIAADIVATLLLKDTEDTEQKISLFINSEGGDIRSVFMIYDMMMLMQSPLETICVGSAMHEAALLLAAGTPGLRFATGNAVIVMSQLMQDHNYYSDLMDAKAMLKRFQADNSAFVEALAKHTQKTSTELMSSLERQKFLTAKQASSFGIIDHLILGKRNK